MSRILLDDHTRELVEKIKKLIRKEDVSYEQTEKALDQVHQELFDEMKKRVIN